MNAPLRIMLAAALATAWISPARTRAVAPHADACARHAPEAAMRSGLPVDIVRRVMRAESRGSPRALSYRGAMGCMQIMPATWTYLARRYALGNDPFNPRMNMIVGALYLAELAHQFGFPGAYSAYNAGPGRYLRYVEGDAPLPAETIAYAAQITDGGAAASRSPGAALMRAPRWQEAGLFMVSLPTRAGGSAATNDAGRQGNMPVERAPGDRLFPLSRPAAGASREASASARSDE